MNLKEQLSFFRLNEKKMSGVKGSGINCGCACAYAGSGGSSVDDNCNANHSEGLWSPQKPKCVSFSPLE
jgi:hypothetical protein